MKQKGWLFFWVLILCTFCGCEPFYDKQPTQTGIKWIASNEEIYFIVDFHGMTGEMNIDGTVTKIRAFFFSNIMMMEPLYPEEGLTAPECQILSGTCDYYQNKFVVHHIKVNRPELFDDSITRLVFVKDKDYVPEDLE